MYVINPHVYGSFYVCHTRVTCVDHIAKLKLNLKKDVSSMYLTQHTFILQVYMHECAMKITDIEALVQTLDVCMTLVLVYTLDVCMIIL